MKDFEGSVYLLLGINKKLYKTEFSGYKHNISFVGRPLTGKKTGCFNKINKRIRRNKLVCYYEDHFKKSVAEIEEKNLFTDIELEAYKASYKKVL